MQPKLINGKVWIPKRAEGPGGAIGDGWVELKPGEPNYDLIYQWLTSKA